MIDTTLFAADIPAGTYSAGDTIELKCIAGPATVRSGRGAAFLKMISSGEVVGLSGSKSVWKIKVQNSDWIDDAINITGQMTAPTAADVRSGCNNFGHDCPLTPNSSWKIIAECALAATTTVANSIYTLLDIDYPQVASIVDPAKLAGIPTGIEYGKTGAVLNAAGTLTTSGWEVSNVDIFKAGYQYALEKIETLTSVGASGFISISDAAGMQGLSRIIPVVSDTEGIKHTIDYASALVKGPMNIKTMLFNGTAATPTTANLDIILDYVKRRV